MADQKYPTGSKITFYPGPRSTSEVTAKVTGFDGTFYDTTDDTGKTRRVRQGSARAAA